MQVGVAAELAAAGLAPTEGAPSPRDFEYADANRLPLLMAVIKESLRLFSPGSLGTIRLTRETTQARGAGGQAAGRPRCAAAAS